MYAQKKESDPMRISVDEVSSRMRNGDKFLFVDTRAPDAWEGSQHKLPNALRIWKEDLKSHLAELPKEKEIVTYCT